ncbi:MAG: ATP-binding protein [Candidatus Eremiobacteraeota bacterium]|nr:ATP-binding protein [Candidatus Eremiobacteraeota bacterium]
MKRASALSLHCPAHSRCVAPARHALAAFLRALEFDRHLLEDVTTAAGEALANIVEHAYADGGDEADGRYLELTAEFDGSGTLAVDVADGGSFIARHSLPGRGFGLRIIRTIAQRLTIDTAAGTRLRMVFECKS